MRGSLWIFRASSRTASAGRLTFPRRCIASWLQSSDEKTHRLNSVLLTPMNHYWIVVVSPSCLQLIFFLRWLHRRTRDDEIRRAFVRDMAINHLPHLYHALRQIAGQLGIELKDPPPVQFLELNGSDRKR